MTNAGTWNSDTAMFYLIIFMVPIFLMILKWVLEATPDQIHIDQIIEKEVEVPVYHTIYKEKPVYKTKVVEKIVYRDRPSEPKPQPVDGSIKNDVVSGLCGLGIRKQDAKKIVSSLSAKKNYRNADSLMRDCLASL